jgi:lipoprotein-releasing system ATP-binding protein
MDEEEGALTQLTQLGFVFQFHFLLPEFTILDNVILPMRALGRLSLEAMRARATCSPRSAWPITCTSGRATSPAASARGWRWHARSPTSRRSFWPTNQPARSIPTPARQVFEVLRELLYKHGKTVVAVTHDLALAERMDRHVELLDGGIVSDEQHRLGITGRR